APTASAARSPLNPPHISAAMPKSRSSAAAAGPSRPTGARTRTRSLQSAPSASTALIGVDMEKGVGFALIERRASEDAAEVGERRPDYQPARAQAVLADCILMDSAALLHHRDGATYAPFGLEVAQHQHGIAQVTDVERRLHRPHQSVLRQDKNCQH